ncbi:gustatory receptor [Homalodisca vitripennis]|nr:gustatory receptor [Homalodisca vitripennis]
MTLLPKEILWFSKVFGVLPFNRVLTSNKSESIELSLAIFTWGLTFAIYHTVATVWPIYIDYMESNNGRPIRMRVNMDVLAVLFDMLTLNCMAVTVFFCSVKYYCNFIEMFTIVKRFDRFLQINSSSSYARCKVLNVTIYLAILLTITAALFTKFDENFSVYVPSLLVHGPQAAFFLQFTHVCSCIKRRYKIINKKIKWTVMRQSFVQGTSTKSSAKVFFVSDMTTISKLKFLTNQYWQLSEAFNQANIFFSAQLFISIASLFIHTIITLYYFILHVWLTMNVYKITRVIIIGLWVFTHVATLIILVRSGNSVTTELDLFLLQLLHNNASFSALGLFQVKMEILTAMAGSITTYLVILIQFQAQTLNSTQP